MRAIVLAVDDQFIAPFLVTIRSLAIHGLPGDKPRLFVLCEKDLSADAIQRIHTFCSGVGLSIEFVDVSGRLPDSLPVSSKDHVSKATFYRLFTASLLPADISTALYLDADLLIRRDICDLFSLQMTAPIAAADHLSPPDELRLWGPKGGGYFQAGVLLLDLDAWRRSDQERRFHEILRTERHRIRWWDQDVLNIAFADNWQRLDIWNNVGFRAAAAIPAGDLREQARIVHFDGGDKPWTVDKPRAFRDEWYAEYEKVFNAPFNVRGLRRPLWRRAMSSFRRRLGAAFAAGPANMGLRRG